MGWGNDQGACADHVTGGAKHLDLILGVVGDLPLVLQIARESEKCNAFDLGLEVTVQFLHGIVDHCTSLTAAQVSNRVSLDSLPDRRRLILPISSRYDFRLGALAGSILEHFDRFVGR